MQRVFILAALGCLIVGCGSKKEEKKDGFEVSRAKKESKKEVASGGVPVDLDNVGVGPIKELTFPDEIDKWRHGVKRVSMRFVSPAT